MPVPNSADRKLANLVAESLGGGKPQDDPVNPLHYRRGPEIPVYTCDTYGNPIQHLRPTMQRAGKLWISIQCIDVCRNITDFRLATAVKYIWRVAFGGKVDEDPTEAIEKAMWYLRDFVENLRETDNLMKTYDGKLDNPVTVQYDEG